MQPEPPEFPVVPLDGVTELRIHGVSGTPVESMLRDPHPVQVWGDDTAGFYRRADDTTGATDHLEAYSWGGLTAKSAARAAWLLLLPFMLVNVAAWAHPARPSDRNKPVGLMSGALRVLGLVLTATLVLTVTVLGMDVLAWQCAGAPDECGSRHWYTRWLTAGWASRPGARIALGALLPIAVVFLIWRLSRSTSRRYEEHGYARPPQPDSPDLPRGVHDLSHPRFWQGGGPVARLRSLHLAASYALVGGLVAYAARTGDTGRYRGLGTALTAVACAAVLAVAVQLFTPFSGRRRELIEGRPPPAAYCRSVKVLRYAAFGALVVALGYAAFLSDRPAATGEVPGPQAVKHTLVSVQWALMLVLVGGNVAALRQRRGAPPDSALGPLFKGYAAPVLAGLAIVLTGAWAAGLTLRAGDYLGCIAECDADGGVAFVLPVEYFWSARSFTIAVLLAIPVAFYVALVTRPRARRKALADVEAEYPGRTDAERRRTIAEIHATAALTDVGGGPLVFVVGGALVLTALTTLLYDEGTLAARATGLGTWLVGAFALWLVALGRSAYRNAAMRRSVGILWDLGTFWPRAAHPFAPPCYCERTVPEIVRRIDQIHAAGGRVVVSAHSQGTVIGLATTLQFRGDADGVALLTYGSPLQRFYARAFPHFFGLPVLDWGRGMLADRWINLYRRSDPIGGPVTGADVDVPYDATRPDRRLRDPAFAKPEYAFHWPTCKGHSHYDHDPAFAESVAALAAEVRAPVGSAPPCAAPSAVTPTRASSTRARPTKARPSAGVGSAPSATDGSRRWRPPASSS